MRFLRFLVSCLAVVAAIAVLVVIASFSPLVQTWGAGWALRHQTGIKGSVGIFSAEFGKLRASDLRIERNGAVLKVPYLEARLPVAQSLLDRQARFHSISARGWTLDLTGLPKPQAGGATAIPAVAVVRQVGAAFGGWDLPWALSADEVDLEGDIISQGPSLHRPVRMRIRITGGGLADGGEAHFDVEARRIDEDAPDSGFGLQGKLTVHMDSPRSFDRIGFQTELSNLAGALPGEAGIAANFAAAREAGGESFSLDAQRGGRNLATIGVRRSGMSGRLEGEWTVDLSPSDMAAAAPGGALAALGVAGHGKFTSDAPYAQARAVGRMSIDGLALGTIVPALGPLGTARVAADVDATLEGHRIRLNAIQAAITGPVSAEVAALQPFDFDETSGDFTAASPGRDVARVSVRDFPLETVGMLPGSAAFRSGSAAGTFLVRIGPDGTELRTVGPATAKGVSLGRNDAILARHLDLAAKLHAKFGQDGWQAEATGLGVSCAGARLASLDLTASGGSDQPANVSGKWSADLRAIASRPQAFSFPAMSFASASGNFNFTPGSPAEFDGDLSAVGAGTAATANWTASIDPGSTISFRIPVKIGQGVGATDAEIAGVRSIYDGGPHLDIKVTGASANYGHLRRLAGLVASAAGAGQGGIRTPAGTRDTVPFWGGWPGQARVSLENLYAGGKAYRYVEGTLRADNGSLRLEGGRSGRPGENLITASGAIAFNPAARMPYDLRATVTVADLDPAAVFGAPAHGEDPVVEGKFSATRIATGQGIDLDDLLSFTQEDTVIESGASGGILRLFKADLNNVVTPKETPVRDTAKSVGMGFAELMGVQKDDASDADRVKLGKNTEAVLDFSYEVAEIGYDRIRLEAVRRPDGTLNLAAMELVSPGEHILGVGKIAYAAGLPMSRRPLTAVLRMGVKGDAAGFLKNSGLLSTDKDTLGYATLKQDITVRGTLAAPDMTGWSAILASAIGQNPPAKK